MLDIYGSSDTFMLVLSCPQQHQQLHSSAYHMPGPLEAPEAPGTRDTRMGVGAFGLMPPSDL